MTSLVTTAEVIARVAAAGNIDTDALQLIIDANEILMNSRMTPVVAEFTMRGYPASVLLLPERVASIDSVTEHWLFADSSSDIELDPTDFRLAPGGTAIERREDGVNVSNVFSDEVIITATPYETEALRKNILIQLCAVDVNSTGSAGLKRQRLGDYEEEKADSAQNGIAVQKAAILDQLMPALPVFS